jgi:hypothetical protein
VLPSVATEVMNRRSWWATDRIKQGWELVTARPLSGLNGAVATFSALAPPMDKAATHGRAVGCQARRPSQPSLPLASRSAVARFCSADSTRFARNGLVPMRKAQLGQLTAVHLRTSLATPQQQSKHRPGGPSEDFFPLVLARISEGTPGCLPISSPSSPGYGNISRKSRRASLEGGDTRDLTQRKSADFARAIRLSIGCTLDLSFSSGLGHGPPVAHSSSSIVCTTGTALPR